MKEDSLQPMLKAESDDLARNDIESGLPPPMECEHHHADQESFPTPDSTGSSIHHHADDGHEWHHPPQTRGILGPTILMTMVLEGITCILRFGMGMESTRDTASTVGRLTGGIRIHHGYLGILVVLLANKCCHRFWWMNTTRIRWMNILGCSLIASDLIHHFLVLWPVTGSPHFDFVYPK